MSIFLTCFSMLFIHTTVSMLFVYNPRLHLGGRKTVPHGATDTWVDVWHDQWVRGTLDLLRPACSPWRRTRQTLFCTSILFAMYFEFIHLFHMTLIDKIRRVSYLAANHDRAAWWFAALTFKLRINDWLQMRWVSCFLHELASSYRFRSRSGNGWVKRKQKSTAGEWTYFFQFEL